MTKTKKRMFGSRRLFAVDAGASVRLDTAEVPETADERKWIQVAKAGEFKGHQAGKFTLSAEVFEQAIANFRSHPWFTLGDDGFGSADVIPFDFHHQSELDPKDIPVTGVPAASWAQDLRRMKSPEGVDGLWALVRYLEPARSYVKSGAYQSTSICLWPDAVDPVSGENIGWYISSIAFTNDPFIQGMERIAAARSFMLDASPVEQLICRLRYLFGLPEMSGVAEVLASIATLKSYTEGLTAPTGVDVERLIGELRMMLGLPVLSSTEDVFLETDKILGALAEVEPVRATRNQENLMDPKEALALIAEKLKLDRNTAPTELVKAVTIKLENGDATLDKLTALFTALGVPDAAGATASIVELMNKAKNLEELMPELASLREMKAKVDGDAEEAEVAEVMAARGIHSELKPALLSLRKTDPAGFAKHYPKIASDRVALSRTLVTPQGIEGVGDHVRLPAQQNRSIFSIGKRDEYTRPTPATGDLSKVAAEVMSMPGRNNVEKSLAFCRSQPESKALSYDALFERAEDLHAQLAPYLSH